MLNLPGAPSETGPASLGPACGLWWPQSGHQAPQSHWGCHWWDGGFSESERLLCASLKIHRHNLDGRNTGQVTDTCRWKSTLTHCLNMSILKLASNHLIFLMGNTIFYFFSNPTKTCALFDWSSSSKTYHRGLQQAECSCKALLCPYDSAFVCSPPPSPPQPYSWRLRRPGRLVSCGTPLKSRYTRSERERGGGK